MHGLSMALVPYVWPNVFTTCSTLEKLPRCVKCPKKFILVPVRCQLWRHITPKLRHTLQKKNLSSQICHLGCQKISKIYLKIPKNIYINSKPANILEETLYKKYNYPHYKTPCKNMVAMETINRVLCPSLFLSGDVHWLPVKINHQVTVWAT